MPKLLEMLNNEMDAAKENFDQHEARLKVLGVGEMDRNMPPVTGQLGFSQELRWETVIIDPLHMTSSRHKIGSNMTSFQEMEHPTATSEEAGHVYAKYQQLDGQLKM